MRTRWKVGDDFLAILGGIWLLGWVPAVLIPALAAGLVLLAGVMWESRPRRVTEPILTDLREAPR